MKELKIDWLDSCPKCDGSIHVVNTDNGSDKWLYSGDEVTCIGCGKKGEVEEHGGAAWVEWGEEDNSN